MPTRTGITSKPPSIIDKAIEDPKANIKEKTWRYRGNIYTNLAADSALYAQVPDALEKAAMSLAKADELDVKKRYAQNASADVAVELPLRAMPASAISIWCL